MVLTTVGNHGSGPVRTGPAKTEKGAGIAARPQRFALVRY
jgi:hypothetical protein